MLPMSELLPSVLQSFTALHAQLTADLQALDPAAHFVADPWQRPGGGGGRTHVFTNGQIFEKAGINFSHVHGPALPQAATKARPDLANAPFHATGVSLVFHPLNPWVPTAHMNVRFLAASPPNSPPVCWFGGGFDLTPFYPLLEDVIAWHAAAKAACDTFGPELYPRFKSACDQYFFLPHRNEQRGVGGLFFDDLASPDLPTAFQLTLRIANAFFPAFSTIAKRHKSTAFTPQQRDFQLFRRGRYVEFNLVHDRGTLFGLQSGGRTESILMSLPPLAKWEYQRPIAPNSPEARLTDFFLKPQDWLALNPHLNSTTAPAS